jgi:hypothetical protein
MVITQKQRPTSKYLSCYLRMFRRKMHRQVSRDGVFHD